MLLLSRIVGSENACHCAPRNLQLYIVWLYAQYQSIIVDRDNRADDASAGDYGLPVLQRFHHFFLSPLLPLHGPEHQKVENGDHQDHRYNLRQGRKPARRGGCCL